MLEGYSVQMPTAIWSSARGVWETTQASLLCEHLELFSEVWPTSGMMRGGKVFAPLMQERHTTDTESSSLRGRAIPTPTVMDSTLEGGYSRTVTKSQPYRGLGLVTWADRAAENNLDLLRTPVADETGGGAVSPAMAKAKGQTLRLTGQIIDLVEPGRLPTPTTRDHKDGTIAPAKHRPDDKDTLTRAMAHKGDTEWGQYEAAVRRWEQVLGREVPKPTEPTGRDGQQQLSARFTEWMMGLDDGWITSPEIGLTRNEALKACGNGVVPQQAVLALGILLDGVDW